jgi:hypothetical protein
MPDPILGQGPFLSSHFHLGLSDVHLLGGSHTDSCFSSYLEWLQVAQHDPVGTVEQRQGLIADARYVALDGQPLGERI